MNFDFDPELPAGFQDSDLEMRELQARADRVAWLRAHVICDHGWTSGPPGSILKPTTVWTCLHCGAEFQTEAELEGAQEAAREMAL